MKKIFLGLILFTLIIAFSFSYVFAADNNSMLENAANGIRNVVGSAENTVENAAKDVSNTSKNATGAMENEYK